MKTTFNVTATKIVSNNEWIANSEVLEKQELTKREKLLFKILDPVVNNINAIFTLSARVGSRRVEGVYLDAAGNTYTSGARANTGAREAHVRLPKRLQNKSDDIAARAFDACVDQKGNVALSEFRF